MLQLGQEVRTLKGDDIMRYIDCLYEDCKELCPYNRTPHSCETTIHHSFYPKNLYRTKRLKQWREKRSHKVVVCRGLHDALHTLNCTPKQPDNETLKNMNH